MFIIADYTVEELTEVKRSADKTIKPTAPPKNKNLEAYNNLLLLCSLFFSFFEPIGNLLPLTEP